MGDEWRDEQVTHEPAAACVMLMPDGSLRIEPGNDAARAALELLGYEPAALFELIERTARTQSQR